MSDAQSLKDCIGEYRKANKNLDDKLTKIEEDSRQRSREREEQSNHPA